jgi:hypothetical protein
MATKVTVKLKELGLSDKGKIELARLALEFMEKQARDGISATGAPHGQGRDKPIDLHDTGRLFRDVLLYSGSVRFQAPYASHVNQAHPFAGIAPQNREEFLRRAAEIMRRELVAGGRG